MPAAKKQITVTPEKLVEALAEVGCSKKEVAARLGISVDTFDRRDDLRQIYEKGRETGKSKLREKLIQTALAGNVTALIFLGKSMLGLKETNAFELSGPDGQPIQTSDARERLTCMLSSVAARTTAPSVPGEPDPERS